MAEYGDPDKPEEWESIKTFSPYHNVADNAAGDHAYPDILFTTYVFVRRDKKRSAPRTRTERRKRASGA